jgi:hypothetical protein
VGRHAAADGGAVHPLVAAALAHRPAEVAGVNRHARLDEGSGLGWPGPTSSEGGLGWPGSVSTTHAADDSGDTADPEDPADEPVPPAPRGWRRLFGSAA